MGIDGSLNDTVQFTGKSEASRPIFRPLVLLLAILFVNNCTSKFRRRNGLMRKTAKRFGLSFAFALGAGTAHAHIRREHPLSVGVLPTAAASSVSGNAQVGVGLRFR